MDNLDYFDKITTLGAQTRELSLQHWFNIELFSWQWWLGIILIIVPLILWWILVDKKRLMEISLFGLFVIIFATFLDVTGADMLLWLYPIRILPQTPLLFPVDLVDLPIVLMLIYQRYSKWGKFIFMNALTAAVMAFILEPISVYIGVYKLISWKFIYSFPIYILIAVIAKLITGFFRKKQLEKSDVSMTDKNHLL